MSAGTGAGMSPGAGGTQPGAPAWRRLRVGALLVVAALLLIAVAVGSRSSVAGPIPVPSTVSAWQAAFEALVGVLGGGIAALSAVVLVAIAFRRPGRRRGPAEPWVFEPPPIPWWVKLVLGLLPVVIMGGLIAWLLWSILHSPRQVAGRTVGPAALSGGSGSALPGAAARAATTGVPMVLWVGVLVGTAVVVATVALLLILRARSGTIPAAEGVNDEGPSPMAAVDAAADALEAEPDPRRAVIAAYATMERLLTHAGSPRREADAPTEHLTRSLVLLGASGEAARRLTDLFERARFSIHVIDEPVRQAAFEALAAVRRDLAPAGAQP